MSEKFNILLNQAVAHLSDAVAHESDDESEDEESFFISAPALDFGRKLHSCVVSPDYRCMYILGGINPLCTPPAKTFFTSSRRLLLNKDVQAWDDSIPDMPFDTILHTSLMIPRVKTIFVIGGLTYDPIAAMTTVNDCIQQYDIPKKRWIFFDIPRPFLRPPTSITIGQSIYIFGDIPEDKIPRVRYPWDTPSKPCVIRYDIVYNMFKIIPFSLPPSVTEFTGQKVPAVVVGNYVYFVGGWKRAVSFKYRLDPFAVGPHIPRLDYVRLEPMPSLVDHHCVAAVGTKVYVIGGKSKTGFLNAVQIYDTVTNVWSYGRNIPGQAGNGTGVSCAVIGYVIYVIGCNVPSRLEENTSVLTYNTLLDTWSWV